MQTVEVAMGARKPRKQVVTFTQRELTNSVFAVVRVSWYRDGREHEVEELQLDDDLDEKVLVLQHLIKSALHAGADVTIITERTAESLGIE